MEFKPKKRAPSPRHVAIALALRIDPEVVQEVLRRDGEMKRRETERRVDAGTSRGGWTWKEKAAR